MHRFLPLSLALLLALPAVQPAEAGAPKPDRLERMTQEFERLFQPMIGAIEARDLVFRDHGGGFMSLSYALDRARESRSSFKAADEKPFRTLACGHMAAEPTNPATLVSAVISDLETFYNLWWTVLNNGEEEVERKTTVKITGPEEFEFEASEDVIYPAGTVQLIWFNPEIAFPATGTYTHRVMVKGGGKALYRFWAEPAATTTVER